MFRRKRIRKALMPRAMEVDGEGLDHSKPLTAAKQEHKQTNIQALTKELEKVSIKSMAADAKKRKKPKYIDTSKLLNFTR